MSRIEFLHAAGVPVVLRFPEHLDKPAPLIVLWHGFNTPKSEQELAETLPLEGVHAWKAYLGLPMFGARLPEGGLNEIERRQKEDWVLKLIFPVVKDAVYELPEVVAALCNQFDIQLNTGIGLFGFSAGGIATMLTLAENKVPVTAAVTAGIPKTLSSAVADVERCLNFQYHWTANAQVAAKQLDFLSRAAEIAGDQPPALLFLHSEKDEIFSADDPQQLKAALLPHYERAGCPERLSLKIFAHLGHQIESPSDDKNSAVKADYAALQTAVAEWFANHLA